MHSLKGILRGVLAATALFCLASVGMAQEQAATSGSQSSTSTSQSTTKKSHKATKGSDASMSATDSSTAKSQLSAADKTFVMKAAQGGMAEVELGQVATQNAKSDEVKQFGQRMVDDHTKANDQLKQLAEQKGVAIPTEPSAKDKAEKEHMSKLKGEQFDKAYMQHMVQDHKKDVAEFKKESTGAKDEDVKNFASQTLPTLEDHLKQAQQIAGTTTGASATAKKSSTTASTHPKQ